MDIKTDFEQTVIHGEFGVCELGSCQYSIINNMINFMKRHRSKYSTVRQLLNQIDIKIPDYVISDIETIKYNLINPNVVKENIDDWDNLISECHKIIDICKAHKMDHLFIAFRKCSFDLWTTVDIISNHTFIKLEVETPMRPDTEGPKWNQIAQSTGVVNGIQCYLFLEHGLIEDLKCLTDFDT